MRLADLARNLRAEAVRTNERRALVLAGDRDAGLDAAYDVIEAAEIPEDGITLLTTREGFRFDRLSPKHAARLLGTTRDAVVLDAHEDFSPNTLGQVVGTVDGGGLLLLLTPPLDEWPDRHGSFDEHLAVPPFELDDVAGHFRTRLVQTLRQHPGIAVVDVDGSSAAEFVEDGDGVLVEHDGATGSTDRQSSGEPSTLLGHAFPAAAYEACLTADQSRTLAGLETLREDGHAVVVEADRGRGKSSAAGLAAASLAIEGRDVLVTAPKRQSANEVFVRARALLDELGALTVDDSTEGDSAERGPSERDSFGDESVIGTTADGRIRFAVPAEAAELPGDPDVLFVDEAAALPVRLLARFLEAPSVAFCTTVRGYEGAGRSFDVRFRGYLEESDFDVRDVHLDDPIRYARGDPLEAWAFRALLLDARPPVDLVVSEATPETTEYVALSSEDLLGDEHRLAEAFGLLVLAHYRTEPNDLARLLDAPNLSLRALTHDEHVVAVGLLAREGGLSAETRRDMYDGGRIRGNMLPDVFTSQLRDEGAGVPVGYRVMRIATHYAVRSRGLGSRLLDDIRDEVGGRVDWLGVGYGATPELLSFWERNGYGTVHLSTSRNDASGEYSALMLDPTSDAGRDLRDRHGRWFLDRVIGVLSDPLRDLDPDVARAALRATAPGGDFDPALSERDWRVVVDASYGPGLYTTAPGAFRRLALAHLSNPDRVDLSPRAERLLVEKVLQARPWEVVAADLDFVSTPECMRTLGRTVQPLVDEYGTDAALAFRERYRDDGGS